MIGSMKSHQNSCITLELPLLTGGESDSTNFVLRD